MQTSVQLSQLTNIVEEITGFFIIESHVLETTGGFRSSREVEELWDALVQRLTTAVEAALEKETDAASFLRVKENLLDFVITVEVCRRSWDRSQLVLTMYPIVIFLLDTINAYVYPAIIREVRDSARTSVQQAVQGCEASCLAQILHTYNDTQIVQQDDLQPRHYIA